MANDCGHLPKADPAQLPDDLRRRMEVWFDKAYKDDNLFLTLANRPGVLELFMSWVGFVYTDASSLDPKMLELCRIRMASFNQCVHCSLVRSESLVRKGLNEAEMHAAVGDLDEDGPTAPAAVLPARTITALRLVDLLVTPHPIVDEEAYRVFTKEFSDGELLELAAAIVVGSGWQKLIEAFGIRPDHWTDTSPLPWKGNR